jgi:fucose permease
MRSSVLLMLFIMVIWFVISFVTNLIGPLMPTIIGDFHLSRSVASLLPASFFLAYGLISIPAGALVEARGPRLTLLAAFALNLAGSLAISLWPTYAVVITGLFIIGLGMAGLQVVLNPLMRSTGGESHFAFFAVMAQLVFGLASYVSPLIYAALMQQPGAAARPLVWVQFYWWFVIVYAILIAVTASVRIPRLTLTDSERTGTVATYRELLRDRTVQLFFLGTFAYVGTEQGLNDWMSLYLRSYHHFSPEREGAHAVSWFWGLMSMGCLLGMVLLRLFDARLVLGVFTTLALGCVALALFGTADVSLLAFPSSGFFLSVMWSIIFSLALNSLSAHHGAFSGILCTGIVGGAVVPSFIGLLSDRVGLRLAMLALFVTLGFILSIAFWARPLIRNETVGLLDLFNLGRRGNAHE